MSDLIDRQAAIDALHGYFDGMLETDTWSPCDVYGLIEILPSAQPEKCEDAVSREEAKWVVFCHRDHVEDQANAIDELPSVLPSAQPETHEERTETHACDLISRQAALDWLKNEWDGMVMSLFDGIKALPSAQAEIVRCKDCKYNSNTCGNYVNCDIIPQMFGRTVDNFCSMAERKTDGN